MTSFDGSRVAYYIALARAYTTGWHRLQYTEICSALRYCHHMLHLPYFSIKPNCPPVTIVTHLTSFHHLALHVSLALLLRTVTTCPAYSTCPPCITYPTVTYIHLSPLVTTDITHVTHHTPIVSQWSSCQLSLTRWCKLQPRTTLRCILE